MRTNHKKSHRKGLICFRSGIVPRRCDSRTVFEETLWGAERCCGHCGSVTTSEVPKRKPMPYWCKDCRYFSVRTGTAIARSNVPLRKWAVAIYLCLTSLKSVSSMKPNVSQPTAGYIGVKRGRMNPKSCSMVLPKRMMEDGGRCPQGKQLLVGGVAGVKDRTSNQVRARVVENTDPRRCKGLYGTVLNPARPSTPTMPWPMKG